MNQFPALLFIALSLLCSGPKLAASSGPSRVPGITEPYFDVLLSSSVSGILAPHKLQEGDFVKEGEVIVELDKRLEELEVARRQLVVDLRRVDWEATRQLFEKTSSVSKEELDRKEADYRIAAVENAIAQEQLRRRQIVAPFSGCITELLRDPGEACQPYEPVVHLVDTRRCYFIANLEARHGTELKPGQTVSLEIDGGSRPIAVQGQIVYLSPVVDPASGLRKVKILFENTESQIQPGLAGQLLLPPHVD